MIHVSHVCVLPHCRTPAPPHCRRNIGEGTPPPVDVGSTWGFEEPRLTATGNGCADPACKSWSQGAFPRLDGSRAINGGVPQAMNLSLHLTTLETTVRDWLPNATASLNGVFDFEAFTTVWAENTDSGSWHSKAYQAYSQQLMAQAHPTWNSSRVAAAAKAAFNAAATNLFVETLKTVAPARRNARFGFYGLPLNALYRKRRCTRVRLGWCWLFHTRLSWWWLQRARPTRPIRPGCCVLMTCRAPPANCTGITWRTRCPFGKRQARCIHPFTYRQACPRALNSSWPKRTCVPTSGCA